MRSGADEQQIDVAAAVSLGGTAAKAINRGVACSRPKQQDARAAAISALPDRREKPVL